MGILLEKTLRGFDFAKFTDRNGHQCSVQKSSIATEDCIWLGADKIGLKEFTASAGWIERNEFDGGSFIANNRMHLTREQVAELLPILQRFVDTGELS